MPLLPAQIKVWPKPFQNIPREHGGYYSPGGETVDYTRYLKRLLDQGDLLDHDPLIEPPWIPFVQVESIRTGVLSDDLSRLRGLYHRCSLTTLGRVFEGDGLGGTFHWNENSTAPELAGQIYGILPEGRWHLDGGSGGGGGGGVPGTPGTQWRVGAGVPDNGVGINGDLYLNTTNGTIYQRISGAYVAQASLVGLSGPAGPAGPTGTAGTPGSVWRVGFGAPNNATGINGDFWLNSATGNVYQRSADTYSVVAAILGPAGPVGPAGPAGPAGANGTNFAVDAVGLLADRDDFDVQPASFAYLASDTGDLYIRVGGTPGVWSAPIPFRGPTGPAGPTGATGSTGPAGPTGSVLRTGSGAPSNGTGANGDYYLNVTNGDLYLRNSGNYAVVGNLRGPTGATGTAGANGATGATGATGPAGGAGATGPAGPAGSAGTAGTVWRVGTGAPSSGLGVNGDFYLQTTTGTIFERQNGTYVNVGTLSAATAAVNVSFAPTGTIAAVNVQTALAELDSEKAKLVGGNAFDGTQAISNGNLQVNGAGNISTATGRIYTGASAPATNYGIYTDRDLGVGKNVGITGGLEILGAANTISAQLTNGYLRVLTGRLYTGANPPPANTDIRAAGDLYSDHSVVAGTGFGFSAVQTVDRVLDPVGDAQFHATFWEILNLGSSSWGGGLRAITAQNLIPVRYCLSRALQHGAALTRVRVRVNPVQARSSTLRMRARLYMRNYANTAVTELANVEDGGSVAVYDLSLTPSGTHQIDLVNNYYYVVVHAGNGGTAGDSVQGIDVRWTTTRLVP